MTTVYLSVRPSFRRAGAGTVCRAVCHLVKDGLASMWVGGIDLDVFRDRLVSSTTAGRAFFPCSTGFIPCFVARGASESWPVRSATPGQAKKERTQACQDFSVKGGGTAGCGILGPHVWPPLSRQFGRRSPIGTASRHAGAASLGLGTLGRDAMSLNRRRVSRWGWLGGGSRIAGPCRRRPADHRA